MSIPEKKIAVRLIKKQNFKISWLKTQKVIICQCLISSMNHNENYRKIETRKTCKLINPKTCYYVRHQHEAIKMQAKNSHGKGKQSKIFSHFHKQEAKHGVDRRCGMLEPSHHHPYTQQTRCFPVCVTKSIELVKFQVKNL